MDNYIGVLKVSSLNENKAIFYIEDEEDNNNGYIVIDLKTGNKEKDFQNWLIVEEFMETSKNYNAVNFELLNTLIDEFRKIKVLCI